MKTYKVSKTTTTASLAGAVAGVVREEGEVMVEAIGVTAVNTMVKGVIKAQSFLSLNGISATTTLGFRTAVINGDDVTAITITVRAAL